jgi:hypothetical protein
MTIQLGRAGLDVPVTGWRQWTISGDLQQIEAVIDVSGVAATDRRSVLWSLAWMLSQYPTTEEPVVPLIATGTIAPFSAMVTEPTASVTLTGDGADTAVVSITARRQSHRAHVDATNITTYRANSFATPGSISRISRFVFPPETLDFGAGDLAGYTVATVDTEDGPMEHHRSNTTTAQRVDVDYTIAAENHYKGAARIEQRLAGSTRWVQVPGLRIDSLPGDTRISNGLVRLTLLDAGWWTVEAWDPDVDDWCTPQQMRILAGTLGGNPDGWNVVEARHNRPELVVLSVTASIPTWSGGRTRVAIDFELRRGDAMVAVLCNSGLTTSWDLGVIPAEVATAVDTDKGVIATNDDGAGNKWVILTTDGGATLDTGQGLVQTVSALQTNFGVGIQTGASSPPRDVTTMRREFYGALLSTCDVVQR